MKILKYSPFNNNYIFHYKEPLVVRWMLKALHGTINVFLYFKSLSSINPCSSSEADRYVTC